MRRGHFIIMFAIMFAVLLLTTFVNDRRNNIIRNERENLEEAFLNASDTAAIELAGVSSTEIVATLPQITNTFFSALSSYLNIYEESYEDMEESLYVPLLGVTTTDGFYLCVLGYDDSGSRLQRKWTEKLPFSYEDSAFIYTLSLNGEINAYRKEDKNITRTTADEVFASDGLLSYYSAGDLFTSREKYESTVQSAVANSIEIQASTLFATESFIAGEQGINISYSVPSFLSVIPEDSIGTFFAVYQGIPSVTNAGYEFSGVKAASYIKGITWYYVSEPEGEEYYRTAHKKGCVHLEGTEVGPVDCNTAIRRYGAYGCPDCVTEIDGFVAPPQ